LRRILTSIPSFFLHILLNFLLSSDVLVILNERFRMAGQVVLFERTAGSIQETDEYLPFR
jgi:hypothetical protein